MSPKPRSKRGMRECAQRSKGRGRLVGGMGGPPRTPLGKHMSLKKANKSEKEVEKMRVINLSKEVWGLEKVSKLEEMWGSLPEEAKTRY